MTFVAPICHRRPSFGRKSALECGRVANGISAPISGLMAAKTETREATKDCATPQRQFPRMRSTTLNIQKQKLEAERCIPEKVGKHAKRIDAALPGNHTRLLYDELPWKERSVLAQPDAATEYREVMTRCTDTLRGNLSFYLGGKSPSDGPKWEPNMSAVRATIRFVMATARLDN
ncbi:hypothetical protein M431DRAFT_102124 [Trichoderma harzianum CBS 226.95]|uniref:Uncharacterized protein n=1 Tax=Trichoderma harzianum CBS 226.95 TaxID=983964 RepID=A0A2T3ZRS8_TRIHA|nr:hypothetical protein M431DRAFT_102124 [Trichoderma harzianum CBS 226.95]PTB47495.1 hypothetical protein M431DRAFT_102124 [Trichoderma harzianum CBS 226.95]